MHTFKLVLVAAVSLAIGWVVGTVAPWWVTALMIMATLAYVAARKRST